MPHNNPGYDVRVSQGAEMVRYIEVKGADAAEPHFFLSEGERRFAALHADHSSLWIYFDMDLTAGTARRCEHEGPIGPPAVNLEAIQYAGLMPD